MGGFTENFGGYNESIDNQNKVEQENTVEVVNQNKKLEKLTQEFIKPLLKDPVLSNKIPKIIEKHQNLIDKGEEKPIVCLSEIINTTKNYLRQFDGDIYKQMESKRIFERYEECINEIVETLNIAEYGEFFLNLRDTIAKEVENPENKGNKREGEFRFIPRVDDTENPGGGPMLKYQGFFKQPS